MYIVSQTIEFLKIGVNMAEDHTDTELEALAEKCQVLENQCAEYVRALQRTNEQLKKEISERKRIEKKLLQSKDV